MKIVYVTSVYLPHIGGLENCVASMAEHYNNEADVVVITADKDINDICDEKINNIRTIRLPARCISGLVFLKSAKYKKIIIDQIKNADIVHHNDCKFIYNFLTNQKKKYKYKLVISSHGFIFHTKTNLFLKKLYFKYIVAKNHKKYDSFICVSEQDERIAKEYGINNTTIIYPGVDVYKFSNLKKKTSGIFQFIYWGRISKNKGIIEALKKLSQLTIPFHAFFIGKCMDKGYMKDINKTIYELNLYDKISFLGSRTDDYIKEKIEQSDFILMPSLHEGFGMTLAECLLSGRKIIANTNDSYRQILNSVKVPQFLFDYEDPESDLNKKIEMLLSEDFVPVDVEQYSDNEMYRRITRVYNN